MRLIQSPKREARILEPLFATAQLCLKFSQVIAAQRLTSTEAKISRLDRGHSGEEARAAPLMPRLVHMKNLFC
jgi:hypothetical protein